MANRLAPKRSGVASAVPTTVQLVDGEIAINYTDKKVYQRVGSTVYEVANYFSGAFSDLSSKPTTLAGYGITDAPTNAGVGATGTWPISVSGGAGGAPIVSVTTTSHTLVLTDANSFLSCSNASAQTITIPPQSSVAWPTNAQIEFMQYGAGVVTVAAGVGVTLRVAATLTTVSGGQYAVFGIKRVATDEWTMFGHLVPA